MVSCVFPGSFDPVTLGHMHLIERASAVFDRVTVAVMINPSKSGRIPVEKRTELLKKACIRFSNVRIVCWDGLLADFMIEKNERILIRGVRNCNDYEQESAAFFTNRMLNDHIEVLLLPTDPCFAGISSSVVREVALFGGDISPFVPEGLAEEITALLSNK